MAYTIFTNSSSSALSSCDTYLIRSVTLTSSSLSLSLKTSIISRLLIKGAVLPSLFISVYAKWLIIPPIRSILSTIYYARTVALVLLLGEVILLCSCCAKKGLVYVVIAALSSCQPSSYSECTKSNIQSSYNVRSVSNTKYIFYLYSSCSDGGNT